MTPADPSKLVEESYDALDRIYREWAATTRGGPRAAFLEEIAEVEAGEGPATFLRVIARRATGEPR
jgi:hypothetical protein